MAQLQSGQRLKAKQRSQGPEIYERAFSHLGPTKDGLLATKRLYVLKCASKILVKMRQCFSTGCMKKRRF
jgi:hypothetical protein